MQRGKANLEIFAETLLAHGQIDRADFNREPQLPQLPPVVDGIDQRRNAAGEQADQIWPTNDQPLPLLAFQNPQRLQPTDRFASHGSRHAIFTGELVRRHEQHAIRQSFRLNSQADLVGKIMRTGNGDGGHKRGLFTQ